MILDARAVLMDDQAGDGSASNVYTTTAKVGKTVMDLGVTGITYDGVTLVRNLDQLGLSSLLCKVIKPFTHAGTMTDVKFRLEQSADNTTFTDVLEVTVDDAKLVAGYVIPGFETLPRGIRQRYIRFSVQTVGADSTAGSVTARFVASNDASYQG